MEIYTPTFWTAKRRRGGHITLLHGRGRIVDAQGRTVWEEPEWMPNSLADEGEQNVLNTWLLEQAALTKYLALLTATPTDTTTMATMTELFAPPLNGYSRVQISSGDWSAPSLNSGDYQTSAAEKTFGPASSNAWSNFTYAALVSTSTGTAGKFLCYIALSGTTSISIGQSFKYTLTVKAQ